MKKFNELRKNEKGFTLIELIIVIAILAIIAAVAVPNIISAVDNSRRSADVANAKIILNAAVQLQAKDASASYGDISGSYVVSAGEVEKDASGAAEADGTFGANLIVELNNSAPIPKFQGAGVGATDHFQLIIAPDGSMIVNSLGATATVQVAPVPHSVYDQK